MMTNSSLETYDSRLQQLSANIHETVANLRKEVQPIGTANDSGRSNSPLSLDDPSYDDSAQELTATLLEVEVKLEQQISDAVQRIRKGTFGICTRCGKRIPEERLDALPYVQHCVNCSEAAFSASPLHRPERLPARKSRKNQNPGNRRSSQNSP